MLVSTPFCVPVALAFVLHMLLFLLLFIAILTCARVAHVIYIGILDQSKDYCTVQVQFDFNRNKYFSSDEALEYGVIDKIIKPPRGRVVATPK